RAHGIGAHPDHLRVLGAELLVAVAERARLERAPGGLVLRIEVEHHRLLAEHVTQPNRLAPLVGQREIRRNISHAHLLFLAHRGSPLVSCNVASWRRGVVQPSVQCAPAPPGIPLLLCINSSSGSDSTKQAPNKRNSCSNESISACRVTWRSEERRVGKECRSRWWR